MGERSLRRRRLVWRVAGAVIIGAVAVASVGIARHPLHWAARWGLTGVASRLLAEGYSITARDADGATPLHVASREGHLEVATVLLADWAIEERDKHGATPLHYAAWGGSRETAELLVSRGASPRSRDTLGRTPLHYARSAAVAELLFSKGAQVDDDGIPENEPAFMKDLLKEQPQALLVSAPGGTPLDSAAGRGDVEVMKFLLDHGASVDSKNRWGITPLHEAAAGGHLGAVELLVERGADVNAKDRDGDTPLVAAQAISHSKRVARFLREHGAKP